MIICRMRHSVLRNDVQASRQQVEQLVQLVQEVQQQQQRPKLAIEAGPIVNTHILSCGIFARPESAPTPLPL